MKIKLAIEWFLNPDHLPFIIALNKGFYTKNNIDFELIQPNEHYDGLQELGEGNIQFATNEPLHLIEQFDRRYFSLGMFFETKGGVLLKKDSYKKILDGETITVTTPVSNDTTNTIGFEIIRRFYAKSNIEVYPHQVNFIANGFEHLKYMKEGADAGWLYFYNFEGIEAKHENMDVLYLDSENANFANFSALDLFVNRDFFEANPKIVSQFVNATKEAIVYINTYPEEAMAIYYDYTKENPSSLMNDILKATMSCFNANFESLASKELPILQFFKEIGISSLSEEEFKTAFLN